MDRLPGLGCQADWQRSLLVGVGLIGCPAVKARMRAPTIVPVEVLAEPLACRAHAVVSVQIDLLVFHAAPQPFDEHVVPPRPFAVHADLDVVLGQHAGEGWAGELRALIGIEDVAA